MIKRAVTTALLSSLVTLALACGSDPNQKANDAHDAQLKTERKQAESNAEQRSDSRVDAAEAQREAATPNRTAATTAGPTAADAKLKEARDVYRAKATERLEKAEAKTKELKALIAKAGAKATTSARDSVGTVETQRAMVAKDLQTFPNVSDDDFERTKSSIDSKLDTLDGLVKKATNEVESFKK